jgi:hypothetical protein
MINNLNIGLIVILSFGSLLTSCQSGPKFVPSTNPNAAKIDFVRNEGASWIGTKPRTVIGKIDGGNTMDCPRPISVEPGNHTLEVWLSVNGGTPAELTGTVKAEANHTYLLEAECHRRSYGYRAWITDTTNGRVVQNFDVATHKPPVFVYIPVTR